MTIPNPGGAPTTTEPGAIVFIPLPEEGFTEDEIYSLFSSWGMTAAGRQVFHMPGHHDQLTHGKGKGGGFDERVKTAKTGKSAHKSVPHQYEPGGLYLTDSGLSAADEAIGEYVIDGEFVNESLRASHTPTYSGEFVEMTDAIDGAMGRSKLPEDVVVYRGVKSAKQTFGDSYRSSSMVGMEWTDRGYASTTVNDVVADRFTGDTAFGVRMRILAPAGMGAIAINDHEEEILLPRGLKFRVVSDVLPEHGPRQFDVEIVP